MRLWHYKMIPVLPRKQLIAQLRECVQIGHSLHDRGTPNHIIVNRVISFYPDGFATYCKMIIDEVRARKYNVSKSTIEKLNSYCKQNIEMIATTNVDKAENPFPGFHNDRYLRQCFYNLEEKYDDGIISDDEWKEVEKLNIK